MLSFKKKLILLICSLLPILAVAGWSVYDQITHNYVLELELLGNETVFVEYGEAYQEYGGFATGYGIYFDEFHRAIPVQVDGEVNDRVLGDYTVTYHAKFKKHQKTLTRTVSVVDTVAPEITLTASEDTYTLPGHPYEEEGFAAYDAYDGDLTSLVERKEEEGFVHYTVSDSSGNETTVIREIHYDDPIPPTIYLKGDSSIAMTAGKPYKDPGYWAQDNCDGDITKNVRIKGSVDGQTPGTYTLEYTVEDSYGNVAQAKRTVVVSPHPVQEYVENPEKVIYLTFDDGPGPETPALLDILKEYNVKATFFVVNTDCIDTIKRTAAEGHTVAIHSATHDFHKIYASEDAYFEDLNQMQKIIYDLTGIEAKLLRFPGGTSNTISKFNKGIMTRLVPIVREQGFRFFDWNVDSDDAGGATTADEVYANVISGIGEKKNVVVLQHDIKAFSIEAVPWIITWGLENGYTFLPLTESSPECEHPVYN